MTRDEKTQDTPREAGLSAPEPPEFGPDCPPILAWMDGKDKGAKHERARIVDVIDKRIDAGRGIPECWPEAQTLAWVKRNIVGDLA